MSDNDTFEQLIADSPLSSLAAKRALAATLLEQRALSREAVELMRKKPSSLVLRTGSAIAMNVIRAAHALGLTKPAPEPLPEVDLFPGLSSAPDVTAPALLSDPSARAHRGKTKLTPAPKKET
jgi:hypothetical protein